MAHIESRGPISDKIQWISTFSDTSGMLKAVFLPDKIGPGISVVAQVGHK